MSHFSIALDDVLERMKTESATTRQKFAERIPMPLSTLTGYAKDTFAPDAIALGKICASLPDKDAQRIIIAHLTDQTPSDWRSRLRFVSDLEAADQGVTFERFNTLPKEFLLEIEAILEEAKGNEQIISFFHELTSLLGIDPSVPRQVREVLCPPPGKVRSQPVPAGAVHAPSGQLGSSTVTLNEEPRASSKPPDTRKAKVSYRKKK